MRICEGIIAFLPRTTRKLVELLGFEETLALLDAHGGTKVYIPKMPQSESALRLVLSDDVLEKLRAEYAGETIELPKPDSMHRARRDYELAQRTGECDSQEHIPPPTRVIGKIRRRYRI